jgi:hypothetical protein
MGVIGVYPLIERWRRKPVLPWVRHAVVVEESDKGAQTLGRFGQVPVPVFWEVGAIPVDEVGIHLTDGVAVCVDPLRALLSGTQKPLDIIPGIAFMV